MEIGNIQLENNVFLAPMAGVTDISFRGLCKEMGCGLITAEMVSDKAIFYGNKKTIDMLFLRTITDRAIRPAEPSHFLPLLLYCFALRLQ